MIRRPILALLVALAACGGDASGGRVADVNADSAAVDGAASPDLPSPNGAASPDTATGGAAGAVSDGAETGSDGGTRGSGGAGDPADIGDPAGDAGAADAPSVSATDPYAILARASDAYERLRAIQADFRQEARNPVLRRTIRSSGTLYQRQPNDFLMRFREPAGDVIVSDGEHLWVYYPSVDSAQVLRLPAARGAGATDLRSQFIGNPAERFRATSRGEEPVGGRPADILVLEPRGDGEGYRSQTAWIDRQDGLARRFEIVETKGLVRRFEVSGIRRNPDLPDSLFRFEPPEGVRVVDRG
jgi:outer membrane lipoprotein carrier protein